jgi:hypothetical protein
VPIAAHADFVEERIVLAQVTIVEEIAGRP